MQVLSQHIQKMIDIRRQIKAELKLMSPDEIYQLQNDIKRYVNTYWSEKHANTNSKYTKK